MGVEHLTFDESYYTGNGYGGYTNILGAPAVSMHFDGVGAAVAQSFLDKGFSLAGLDILVLGAAVGHLVRRLREVEGANAWGMDISSWAVANEVTGGFVLQGDARVPADIDAVETAASVSPRWDGVVTENVIACLTDAELNVAVPEWRNRVSSNPQLDWSGMVHLTHTDPIVDEYDPVRDVYDEPYTNRSLPEWRAFLDAQLSGGDRPDWVWNWRWQTEG